MEKFIDTRDGKEYKVVQIGNLLWMAENLAYEGATNYSADNDRSNDSKYGYLYTWKNAKKACPPGWRLPTREEFEELLKLTGARYTSSSSIRSCNWRRGRNDSGFNALPAGIRLPGGGYIGFGAITNYWSSSPAVGADAFALGLSAGGAYVSFDSREGAFSVRCVTEV